MGLFPSKQQKKEKPNLKTQITEKDKAILELKNTRDRLKKYRKKLDQETLKLNEQAVMHVQAKQKTRALLVLKLKKHKINEADNIDKQLFSVYEMIDTIEWESINMKVIEALKLGTSALNELHNEMSVDDVAALLEETNDAIEVENKINSLLAGQLEASDEELENELIKLMASESKTVNGINMSSTTYTDLDLHKLPEAPVTSLIMTSDQVESITLPRQLASAV